MLNVLAKEIATPWVAIPAAAKGLLPRTDAHSTERRSRGRPLPVQ